MQSAQDGAGENSPYTSALIKHLALPDLDLRLALGRVRDEVLRTTNNKQEPFGKGAGARRIGDESVGGEVVNLGQSPPDGARRRRAPHRARHVYGSLGGAEVSLAREGKSEAQKVAVSVTVLQKENAAAATGPRCKDVVRFDQRGGQTPAARYSRCLPR